MIEAAKKAQRQRYVYMYQISVWCAYLRTCTMYFLRSPRPQQALGTTYLRSVLGTSLGLDEASELASYG